MLENLQTIFYTEYISHSGAYHTDVKRWVGMLLIILTSSLDDAIRSAR